MLRDHLIKRLFSLVLTLSVSLNAFAQVKFEFQNGSTTANWPFQPLGAEMAFGPALPSGGLYAWTWEIKTNGFWPGTSPSFGVAAVPLQSTDRHILGYAPGEWGYLGSSGNKVYNSTPTPWGGPVSAIGDKIRIVMDRQTGNIYFYVKRTTDAIFTLAGGGAAYTISAPGAGKDIRPVVAIYSYRGCSVEFTEGEDYGSTSFSSHDFTQLTLPPAGPNTWNGSSWTHGTPPGNSDDVIIQSGSNFPGSFSAANLQLESGADLTINQGETVTITGDITGIVSPLQGLLNNFALTGNSSNWASGAAGTFSVTTSNGLNFDGSNDYVSVPDGATLDFSSGFTLEAWFKADALSHHASLVSKFANNKREFSLLLRSDGSIEYSITFNGSSEQYFTGNTTLSAGNWYHVALTYDGSSMQAYINGNTDGSKNVSGNIYNGSSNLYIGARSEGSMTRFFDGTMDEVRVWNTARSQTDIQNNMDNELTGNETGLVAYYNFNQGTAGGNNTGITNLNSAKIGTYDPNIISGSGTLVFDNSGQTLNLNDISLNMEGVVEVTSGTTLQTNNSLTLTASSASSYGQIIGDGTVLGNVTSQAWMDVSSARYHYLGVPFTDATLEEFNEGQTMVAANSSQGTVWQWNANTASWEAPSSLSDVATNGKGYAMYAGTNTYGTFLMNGNGVSELDGTVANGDIAVTLDYNNGQSSSVGFTGGTTQADTEGWNFLANPYPSQYDWNGQSLFGGIYNALYVSKGGSYASYVSGVGTNGGTQYLAPFQGFWVQTTNAVPGNFIFEQDQRVTAPSTSLMKTSTVDGIWLTVSDSSSSDELFIGFDHQATLGFDARLDARKLLNKNDIPNLYTSGNGEAFSITRVAPNTQTSFPLKLDNVADGRQLSLTLNTDQLLSYNTVVLEDKMLSVLHDLKASDYSFIQNEAYGPNRFVLHFSSPSIGVEEVASAQHWYAYATEDGIEVRLGELKNASIKVYDLSGRIIHYLEHQEGVARIPTNQTRQLYVVKVTSSFASGTQKIIR